MVVPGGWFRAVGVGHDGVVATKAGHDSDEREAPVRTNPRRSRAVRLWVGLVAVLAATTAVGVASAGASGSNTLTVKAGEYTYRLQGSPKAGWTQVDFDNVGVEMHMMAVVALKKGVTAKQLKAAALSNSDAAFAKIAAPGADPSGVSGLPDLIGPGQKTTTLSELPAGHYGIMCFVPAASDKQPHLAHGMVKVFDVAKGKSKLRPPTDGVIDVDLSDTSITFPSDNLGRSLTLKVTNSGTKPHSLTLVKLADGKTLDDAKAYFDGFFAGTAPAGDPPGEIVGGISTVNAGQIAYLEQTLTAGDYGYVSTQGDAPDDDYTLGMKGTFTVK
jgi:hypothetical protein